MPSRSWRTPSTVIEKCETSGRVFLSAAATGARHDAEAAGVRDALLGPRDLAEGAADDAALAAGARDGVRLAREAEVVEEEVGRARWEHAAGDVAATQLVEDRGHGSVAAGEDHEVEVLGVAQGPVQVELVSQDAGHALVPLLEERPLELEDGVGTEAGASVVNDEGAHVTSRTVLYHRNPYWHLHLYGIHFHCRLDETSMRVYI